MRARGASFKLNKPDIDVQISIRTSESRSAFSENQTTIAGSNVTAHDVVLDAANRVRLMNTTDTDSTRSSNSSSGASFGVSVTKDKRNKELVWLWVEVQLPSNGRK